MSTGEVLGAIEEWLSVGVRVVIPRDAAAGRRGSAPLRFRVAGGPPSWLGVAALFVCLSGPARAAVHHPFGSHEVPYAAGAILPSHVSQAALDQAVRSFYDAWKACYLEQGVLRLQPQLRLDGRPLPELCHRHR